MSVPVNWWNLWTLAGNPLLWIETRMTDTHQDLGTMRLLRTVLLTMVASLLAEDGAESVDTCVAVVAVLLVWAEDMRSGRGVGNWMLAGGN